MIKYFNIEKNRIENVVENALEFMVDFTLPQRLSDDFIARVPRQRKMIQRYMNRKKLLSYALSIEQHRMWAVFRVSSEIELMELLANLPLTPLMEVNISTLTVLNTARHEIHEMCMN